MKSDLTKEEPLINKEIEIVNNLGFRYKMQTTYLGADKFSNIDGIFHDKNKIQAIYDIKIKPQSYSWIQDYKSTLVSYHKFNMGCEMSRILKTKFLYIIGTSDNKILVFTITDNKGKIQTSINIRNSDNTKNNSKFENHLSAYLLLDSKTLKVFDLNE